MHSAVILMDPLNARVKQDMLVMDSNVLVSTICCFICAYRKRKNVVNAYEITRKSSYVVKNYAFKDALCPEGQFRSPDQ